MKVYYLKPKSSFRTELRSDTLWGLLISALSYLHPKDYIDNLVNSFAEGNPPFLISSCFPYKNDDGKKNHYLPLPISGHGLEDSIQDYSLRKDLKKMKFIRLELFNDIINSKSSSERMQLLQKEQRINFLKSETNVRIKINRMTNGTQDENGDGQLFNSVENYFIDGGYYFFVNGDNSIIEPALRLLSHNGFGGYTSKGKGNFEVEEGDVEISQPINANKWTTLSLYNPTIDELGKYKVLPDSVWYDTVIRKGKIANQYRKDANWEKKPILSFAEGSVFPEISNNLYGQMTETYQLNEWKVFNYGYAFKIPINI